MHNVGQGQHGQESMSPIINGGLFASCFALSLNTETRVVAIFCAVAVVFFFYNLLYVGRQPTGRHGSDSRWGGSFLLGAAFLALNVVIFSWQRFVEVGNWRAGIKELLVQAVLAAMGLSLVWIYRPVFVKRALLTLALAFLWFAILNAVAGYLGFGNEGLLERERFFASRYVLGGYRMQTPLYSSWQVSGLLRWAIPIAVAYLWLSRLRLSMSLALILGLVGGGVVIAALVEYRAAAFPLCGFFAWLVAYNPRLRAMLAVGFVAYMVVAPFLFGLSDISTLMSRMVSHLPEWMSVVAGDQAINEVASLSGRGEMWADGLQALTSGKHLFLGMGHVHFDASPHLTAFTMSDENSAFRSMLFSKVSFHQALLDLLFIYGLIPGTLIISVVFVVLLRGCICVWRRYNEHSGAGELQFAMLALGMVGLSNCHDGFVNAHNLFYIVCTVICLGIIGELRWRGRATTMQVPPRRPTFAKQAREAAAGRS